MALEALPLTFRFPESRGSQSFPRVQSASQYRQKYHFIYFKTAFLPQITHIKKYTEKFIKNNAKKVKNILENYRLFSNYGV